MELEYLKKKIEEEDYKTIIGKIISSKPDYPTDAVKMYDLTNHEVMSSAIRKRRKIKRTSLGLDGQTIIGENGQPKTVEEEIEVVRVPLALQKYIVEGRRDMMLTNPVELDASAEEEADKSFYKAIAAVWGVMKVDYELKEIAVRQMSECEVAVMLSTENAPDGYWDGTDLQGASKRIRFNILKSNEGTSLYPVYDRYGDMIAFCRNHKVKDDETDKEIHYFDIYTAETNYYLAENAGGWAIIKRDTNIDGKIPIVYFPQKEVEWADQSLMINRTEFIVSNLGEANDRSAFPMLLLKADAIESLPMIDDTGKGIQLSGAGAGASYLETTGKPESIEMEYDTLMQNIHQFSGSIDYNSLHQFFGSAPSGYAIKLLFQNAHMKAAAKEGDFGKNLQRLVNLLKSLVAGIQPGMKAQKNLPIKPVFTLYVPKNPKEEVELLAAAKDAGLISGETAALKCTLTKNPAAEWEKIKEENKNKVLTIVPPPEEKTA